MYPLFKKHNKEKYLFPCSEIKNNSICSYFENNNRNLSNLTVYRTVSNDISDLEISNYDVVTFFTPADVTSFLDNFKDYRHDNLVFATFGVKTSNVLKESGFESKIQAPTTNAPSMARAIELYLYNEIN